MTTQEDAAPRTARALAVDRLPMDSAERSQFFGNLFAARAQQREEMRKVREASQVSGYRQAMGDRFDIEPLAQRMIIMMHDAWERNPVKAAKAFTQFSIISNDMGFDRDVEVTEDDENDGNVFDRTRTAQGMKGYSPRTVNVRRTLTSAASSRSIPLDLVQEYFERALAGQTMRVRVGRPSNVERSAMLMAEDRLAKHLKEHPDQAPGATSEAA